MEPFVNAAIFPLYLERYMHTGADGNLQDYTFGTGNDLTLLPRLPSHFPERTLTGKTLKKENSRKIFKISDSKFQ